jgi:hypothetical protein
MATTTVRNVSTESNNRSTGPRGESKSYQPPTLVKRAILSTVTAEGDSSVSGIRTDGQA